MILERPESNKKLYLHDHTSIAKYIVQYTTRMFLNMSEYLRMVFYMLWKPVWLIWSNPKNYFILVLGCLGCL